MHSPDVKSYDQLVSYGSLDAFKRLALARARATEGKNLAKYGFRAVEASYGESVFLIEHDDHYLAFVLEGLGTKNRVAEALQELTAINLTLGGTGGWDAIAQDTVAMAVNDLAVVGADPLLVGCHIAVGDAKRWFETAARYEAFVEGWGKACDAIGAKWSGGETAGLRDVVSSGSAVLGSGSLGIIKPKDRYIKGDVREGDLIYFVPGTGIHANGLTQAREIAKHLPKGYLTELPDGRTFGEHLLAPTPLLPPIIQGLLERGVCLSYVVPLTGHGYRKLMRLPLPLRYVLEAVPIPQQVFSFIGREAKLGNRELYGTHNMGALAALIVPPRHESDLTEAGQDMGIALSYGGFVGPAQEREVVIEPLDDLRFGPEELDLR